MIRVGALLCEKRVSYLWTTKTQLSVRIFKMTPIHASVIYQIGLIYWIHWIYVHYI